MCASRASGRNEQVAECYAVLEVEPTASAEEIKTAYLDLVKIWHPDRYASESTRLRQKAEEKLKAVNAAYERIRTGAPVFREPVARERDISAEGTPDLRPIAFGDRAGYADAEGRLVIPPRFEEARPFAEGLAVVRESGRFGYIDARGDYAIYPEFAGARSFQQGFAGVSLTERWGYIDRANRFVINPLYEGCGDFSEGLAAVCWRGRWGYIDRTGSFSIRPAYDGARAFREGRAEVRIGERWGYVHHNGEVFFEHPQGEISAAGA